MSKKRVYKVLALFMAVIMAVTSVSIGERRAKAEKADNEIKPELSKVADMLTDGKTVGQRDYNITLTVGGVGETKVKKAEPIDLVFVLDASSSMIDGMSGSNNVSWEKTRWYVMQNNVNAMLENISKLSPQSKVSVVAYGGSDDKKEQDYKVLVDNRLARDYAAYKSKYTFNKIGEGKWKEKSGKWELSIDNDSFRKLQNEVDGWHPERRDFWGNIKINGDGGGTNCKAGFVGAFKCLNEFKNDNQKKYVVYMSDGVPTFASKYSGEYTDDVYNCDYLYTGDNPTEKLGNGTETKQTESEKKKLASYAADLAERISDMEDVEIYTVGIGNNMVEASKYLLNPDGDCKYGQAYKSASSATDMENTFNDILQDITKNTKINAKVVSDKLTDYVELYTDEDMILHIDGKDDIVLEKFSDNNNVVTYQGKDNVDVVYSVTYNKKTKVIKWDINQELGIGDEMALTYRVHTTDKVQLNYTEEEYAADKKCAKGEPNTGTYAGCMGYHSNASASLNYTFVGETVDKTAEFPKPVVRNEVPCTITVTKKLGGDFASLAPKGKYSFIVSLENSALNNAEIRNKIKVTNSVPIKWEKNGKQTWKLSFELGADDSVAIKNVPSGTNYEVVENVQGLAQSKYFENQVAWKVNNKEADAVSGAIEAKKQEGSKEFEYYTLSDSESGKIRYYDSETNKRITGELLRKVKANPGNKTGETTKAYKYENGVWVEVESGENGSEVKPHEDGYYYVDLIDASIPVQTITRKIAKLYDGNEKTVEQSQLTNKVANAKQYFEYVNSKGVYRLTTRVREERAPFLGWFWFNYFDVYTDIETGEKYEDEVEKNSSPSRPNASGIWYRVPDGDKVHIVSEKNIRDEIEEYYTYSDLFGDKTYTATAMKNALKNWARDNKYSKVISGPDKQTKAITFKAWKKRYTTAEEYYADVYDYKTKTKRTYETTIDVSKWSAEVDVLCTNTFTPKKTKLTINKNLESADNLDDNVFIFKIENTDVNSPGYGSVVYKAIAFTKGNTSESVTIDDLYLAFETGYKITEVSHMRYEADEKEKTIALKDTQGGAVTFTNTKVKVSEFSGSACVVNHGELRNGSIHFGSSTPINMRVLAFGATRVIKAWANVVRKVIE